MARKEISRSEGRVPWMISIVPDAIYVVLFAGPDGDLLDPGGREHPIADPGERPVVGGKHQIEHTRQLTARSA